MQSLFFIELFLVHTYLGNHTFKKMSILKSTGFIHSTQACNFFKALNYVWFYSIIVLRTI